MVYLAASHAAAPVAYHAAYLAATTAASLVVYLAAYHASSPVAYHAVANPATSSSVSRAARSISAATSRPCGPSVSVASNSSTTRHCHDAALLGRPSGSGCHTAARVRSTRARRHGHTMPVQSVGTVATER